MKRLCVILSAAALVSAPVAYAADEIDALFLVELDERGVFIPEDGTMLTAIALGKDVCSAIRRGVPATVIYDEIAAFAPNLGAEGVSVFIHTANEIYCPDAVPGVAPTPEPPAPTATPSPSAYYPNCAAVRAAGAAPIYRGDPGYSSSLDRDGDGVACEK